MAKAYRFDDDKPRTGSTVHAFRTLAALKEFAKKQGLKGTMKYWEITGTIIEDDGSPDGIQIKVAKAVEVQ